MRLAIMRQQGILTQPVSRAILTTCRTRRHKSISVMSESKLSQLNHEAGKRLCHDLLRSLDEMRRHYAGVVSASQVYDCERNFTECIMQFAFIEVDDGTIGSDEEENERISNYLDSCWEGEDRPRPKLNW